MVMVTNAQDYQTITSNRIAYFENQNHHVNCIRIDSVKQTSDSILYSFAVIQPYSDGCFSPYIASWIGKSVTIKNNGLNQFVNKENDTITINTLAGLNDSWTAYRVSGSLFIEASVIKYDTMTFLGICDSVKTIGFQSYDADTNLLDIDVNEMQLIISKNYGFVKMLNFYLFPDYEVNYTGDQLKEYTLVGLSNPQTGIQNLTWFNVYDFQVGDELHILQESDYWYDTYNGYSIVNKAIYKYLERNNYADSITYCYSRKQSISSTTYDSSSFVFFDDTLTSVILPDSLFDLLPGEPVVDDYRVYSYTMSNESVLSKIRLSATESYVLSEDSCWQFILADGCLSDYQYLKGLGGPYYSCSDGFGMGGYAKKLVYYKKGDTTWGNPLTVNGISDTEVQHPITIYPNPANRNINIIVEDNSCCDYTVYFYDIKGRLIKTKHFDTDRSTIDIGDLSKGVYLLKIADQNEVIKMHRLIVE